MNPSIEIRDLALNFGNYVNVIKTVKNNNLLIREGTVERIDENLLAFFINCKNISDYIIIKPDEKPIAPVTVNVFYNNTNEAPLNEAPTSTPVSTIPIFKKPLPRNRRNCA